MSCDAPILKLPGELRNLIYAFLLESEPAPKFILSVSWNDPPKRVFREELHGPVHPPLAQTCRALRYEVLDTYYGLHDGKVAVVLHKNYALRDSPESNFSNLPSHVVWRFARMIDFTFTLPMERSGCVWRQGHGQVQIRATDVGVAAELSLMGSRCCNRELEALRSCVGNDAGREETLRRAVSWLERAVLWKESMQLANSVACESCGNIRVQAPPKRKAAKRGKSYVRGMVVIWDVCRELCFGWFRRSARRPMRG